MRDPEFTLLGDAIWLDFVNTARPGSDSDRLTDIAAYHRWTKALKLRSDASERTFAAILEARQCFVGLAEALHLRRHPPAAAIALINEILQGSPGAQQLTRIGGEWRLQFASAIAPDALGAVARSAAGTLSEPLVAVRECASDGCSRFFTDDSLAQSRRWCAESCASGAWVERRRGALR